MSDQLEKLAEVVEAAAATTAPKAKPVIKTVITHEDGSVTYKCQYCGTDLVRIVERPTAIRLVAQEDRHLLRAHQRIDYSGLFNPPPAADVGSAEEWFGCLGWIAAFGAATFLSALLESFSLLFLVWLAFAQLPG